MRVPKLSVRPEPLESGKLVYLATPQGTSEPVTHGRLSMRIDIRNNESTTIGLRSLDVSFPGTGVAAETKAIGKDIASGATLRWWFGQAGDDVLFKLPGPMGVKLAFHCEGFDKSRDFSFPLAASVKR